MKTLKYLLCSVFMMLIIFGFSHQELSNSSKLSDKIVNPIQKVVQENEEKEFKTETEEKEHNYKVKQHIRTFVRKSAHIFLFALLGLSVFLFFASLKQNFSDYDCTMFTMIFCFLYGGFDEIHQSFIADRQSSFDDVCIDLFGTILMMLIIYLVKRRQRIKEEMK